MSCHERPCSSIKELMSKIYCLPSLFARRISLAVCKILLCFLSILLLIVSCCLASLFCSAFVLFSFLFCCFSDFLTSLVTLAVVPLSSFSIIFKIPNNGFSSSSTCLSIASFLALYSSVRL